MGLEGHIAWAKLESDVSETSIGIVVTCFKFFFLVLTIGKS